MMPINVFDVATYILNKRGPMTTMKLHKILYYCQAWSLVWDEKPLFGERIEAWINGPVIPKLYQAHRGEFKLRALPRGNPDKLKPKQIETIDAVIKACGKMTSQQLVDLTHAEAPWHEARRGLAENECGSNEITLASMFEYYSAL